jgi:hypothetical protein
MTTSPASRDYFEARSITSIDLSRDVEVLRPRVEQIGESNTVEFNFTVKKGGIRMGFSTDGRVYVRPDRSVKWEFIFSHNENFEGAIECARRMAPDLRQSDLPYYLADGMLKTYAQGTAIYNDMQITVLARADASNSSITGAGEPASGDDAYVTIASLSIPAQPYPADEGAA